MVKGDRSSSFIYLFAAQFNIIVKLEVLYMEERGGLNFVYNTVTQTARNSIVAV